MKMYNYQFWTAGKQNLFQIFKKDGFETFFVNAIVSTTFY